MVALAALGAAGLGLAALAPAPLAAQQWNDSATLALVRRAMERRQTALADSTLRAYRTRAHGFVFFLGQFGQSFNLPPKLIKADELKLEVYWRAPDQSKQVITGWRDGSWLPNDMNYHRDHLGIVTNNFGDRIRIGEGDEVRDVVHPLAPAGPAVYDYALEDSVRIASAGRQITVYEVRVRPKRFGEPAVIGTLFLDAASAELARFRFSFTPVSYLDHDLEDIDIALENSLWAGRYWLPYRQEIEIRRRVTWLDFPARGIIRGRWEITDYDLDVAPPDSLFQGGPEIAGLRRPTPAAATVGDSSWGQPLAQAIGDVAQPLNRRDMEELRVEVERIAGTHALSGLPSGQLAAGSVSDIVHVNRVQGLALGFGASLGLAGSRVHLRPRIGIGTADGRVTGGLALVVGAGATQLTLSGSRRIRDFSDWPVIAPVFNSLSAQEFGKDYGDYVLLDAATAGIRHPLSARTTVELEGGAEESRSVDVAARPATGTYRPNPALGAGTYGVARLRLERSGGGVAVQRDLHGALLLEGGTGPTDYLRAALQAEWQAPLGTTALAGRVLAGAGTTGLPAYRSFVLGGRGTLVGEPFRAYSGREAVLAHLEWRVDVPVPALPLGSFASTGRTATLAPFVAAGWTHDPMLGAASDGIRPVAGIAVEWPMRILRVEAGVGLRDGRVGVTVDVNRDWWGIL